jgi:hypothetical protein
MAHHTSLLLAVLLVFLGGCSSSGPHTINLMPAPAVFAGGTIDPFPDQPPLTHSDFGLLYATDREPTGSSTGNGHDYFRQSPWVSSDILALLALNLGPDKRGLVPGTIPQLWRFPPDYVQRVQQL